LPALSAIPPSLVLPPPPVEAAAAVPAAAPVEPVEAVQDISADDVIEAAPPKVPEPLPVLSAPAASPALSPERRESPPIAFRVGFAFLLVAVGFGAGRLTAPGSTAAYQPVARSAPPPAIETASVAAAATLAPIPALATPPPSSELQAAMPSGPRGLEPVEKPPAVAAASVVPHAASAPVVGADSQASRRTGVANAPPLTSARSVEAESTSAVIPSATTRPVNSFVQAVHDDIAEDEASHKKP
jgi:hypothetical protein